MTRYDQIGQLNLTDSYSYTYDKKKVFSDFVFDEQNDKVTAKMEVSYPLNPDSDEQTFKSTKINTIRPGVLRAVEYIENRPER